jgi:hypothetical protein
MAWPLADHLHDAVDHAAGDLALCSMQLLTFFAPCDGRQQLELRLPGVLRWGCKQG